MTKPLADEPPSVQSSVGHTHGDENRCPAAFSGDGCAAAASSSLGDWFDPFTGLQLMDPQSVYAVARREAPIFFSKVMGMWVVSRYDDICSVLKDPELFSSRDTLTAGTTDLCPEALEIMRTGLPGGANLINSDPPTHIRLRRALNKAFVPRRIAALEPRIREFANNLIDAFARDGHADLIAQYAYPLPALVILSMVGLPDKDVAQVKSWGGDLFALKFSKLSEERQVECARSVVAYQRYCVELIEQRRKAPQEDLTSDLISTEGTDCALSMAEIVTNISGSLLAAGHETTTTTIGNAVKQILHIPGLWERIRHDQGLIPKVTEECLRIDGAIQGMARTTTRSTVLCGVPLEKGERLFLVYSSGNHDETHFSDPERFDFDRDNQGHLAFGRGIHYCLGSSLARLEIQVTLELLSQRLPDLSIIPGQQFEYSRNLVNRGLKRLLLQWSVI